MPLIKCRYFDERTGKPVKGGCKKPRCSFIHPEDRDWDVAAHSNTYMAREERRDRDRDRGRDRGYGKNNDKDRRGGREWDRDKRNWNMSPPLTSPSSSRRRSDASDAYSFSSHARSVSNKTSDMDINSDVGSAFKGKGKEKESTGDSSGGRGGWGQSSGNEVGWSGRGTSSKQPADGSNSTGRGENQATGNEGGSSGWGTSSKQPVDGSGSTDGGENQSTRNEGGWSRWGGSSKQLADDSNSTGGGGNPSTGDEVGWGGSSKQPADSNATRGSWSQNTGSESGWGNSSNQLPSWANQTTPLINDKVVKQQAKLDTVTAKPPPPPQPSPISSSKSVARIPLGASSSHAANQENPSLERRDPISSTMPFRVPSFSQTHSQKESNDSRSASPSRTSTPIIPSSLSRLRDPSPAVTASSSSTARKMTAKSKRLKKFLSLLDNAGRHEFQRRTAHASYERFKKVQNSPQYGRIRLGAQRKMDNVRYQLKRKRDKLKDKRDNETTALADLVVLKVNSLNSSAETSSTPQTAQTPATPQIPSSTPQLPSVTPSSLQSSTGHEVDLDTLTSQIRQKLDDLNVTISHLRHLKSEKQKALDDAAKAKLAREEQEKARQAEIAAAALAHEEQLRVLEGLKEKVMEVDAQSEELREINEENGIRYRSTEFIESALSGKNQDEEEDREQREDELDELAEDVEETGRKLSEQGVIIGKIHNNVFGGDKKDEEEELRERRKGNAELKKKLESKLHLMDTASLARREKISSLSAQIKNLLNHDPQRRQSPATRSEKYFQLLLPFITIIVNRIIDSECKPILDKIRDRMKEEIKERKEKNNWRLFEEDEGYGGTIKRIMEMTTEVLRQSQALQLTRQQVIKQDGQEEVAAAN